MIDILGLVHLDASASDCIGEMRGWRDGGMDSAHLVKRQGKRKSVTVFLRLSKVHQVLLSGGCLSTMQKGIF